jgi:hypothetical protein
VSDPRDRVESPHRAWPFAIGAGRRLDYRVLAAPDFLVTGSDFGALAERAGSGGGEARVSIGVVRTAAGRELGMAWTESGLTLDDVGEAEPVPGGSQRPVRDEYGRALRLIHGFVLGQGDRVAAGDVDPADLERSRQAGLAAYRRFLADEEGFRVLSQPAFPARSRIRPAPVAVPAPPAVLSPPAPGGLRVADRPAGWSTPSDAAGRRNTPVYALIGLVVVVLVGLFLRHQLGSTGGAAVTPTRTTSAEDLLAHGTSLTLSSGKSVGLDDAKLPSRSYAVATVVPDGPPAAPPCPPDPADLQLAGTASQPALSGCTGTGPAARFAVVSAGSGYDACRAVPPSSWLKSVPLSALQHSGRLVCVDTIGHHRALLTVRTVTIKAAQSALVFDVKVWKPVQPN